VNVYVHAHTCMGMHVCECAYMCVHMDVCMHVYNCVYLRMYVCVCVSTHALEGFQGWSSRESAILVKDRK
jgi:hypothetical protein